MYATYAFHPFFLSQRSEEARPFNDASRSARLWLSVGTRRVRFIGLGCSKTNAIPASIRLRVCEMKLQTRIIIASRANKRVAFPPLPRFKRRRDTAAMPRGRCAPAPIMDRRFAKNHPSDARITVDGIRVRTDMSIHYVHRRKRRLFMSSLSGYR